MRHSLLTISVTGRLLRTAMGSVLDEVQPPCYATHEDYSTMYDECPSTTNAVEHRNAECKQKQPIPLKMAVIYIPTWTSQIALSILLQSVV